MTRGGPPTGSPDPSADELDEATIEALARAYHDLYREQAVTTGDRSAAARLTWTELPEHLRESNRASARAVPAHVRTLGGRIEPRADAPPGPVVLPAGLVEVAAEAEHRRWMDHKLAQGFVFGPTRDPEARTHPSLVDWADLDETERDKDRARIAELPRLLDRAGLRLVLHR